MVLGEKRSLLGEKRSLLYRIGEGMAILLQAASRKDTWETENPLPYQPCQEQHWSRERSSAETGTLKKSTRRTSGIGGQVPAPLPTPSAEQENSVKKPKDHSQGQKTRSTWRRVPEPKSQSGDQDESSADALLWKT